MGTDERRGFAFVPEDDPTKPTRAPTSPPAARSARPTEKLQAPTDAARSWRPTLSWAPPAVFAKSSQWVADLGYPEPEMVRVNAHLGYATRFYQPPSGFQAPWKALVVAASPPASRGAVLHACRGRSVDRHSRGQAGDYPPTDEEGFVAFARSLPVSTLADAIEHATPLSSIVGYRRTETSDAITPG